MSRLGKKGILIPEKTEVSMTAGLFKVKGPKGSLERNFLPEISVTIGEKEITLAIVKPARLNSRSGGENGLTKALWGTYASHIKNMVQGVNDGFEKKLILEGVGFKSQVNGNKLVLALGFSHPVEVDIPVELEVKAEKNLLTISGIDKELVGSFSAKVRALKKPEPYKGKGFRYHDEIIRRKQGKKSV